MDDTALKGLGLVYVTDAEPGITRHKRGKGFCYKLPTGVPVPAEVRKRIASLGLPPAYREVWICIDENGHLQATGLDARGRKQYRYHKDWQSFRSIEKFHQMVDFGMVLPKIRRTIARDVEFGPADVRGVLAALTLLLDVAHLRVGNQVYAEENGTFGATTLLKKHLKFHGDRLELRFTAKGGKRVRRSLHHPRLQRILEAIADLPGKQLFSWRDEDGQLHPVDSGRLNEYLADISGIAISAKTFRTWGGTVAAFGAAREAILEGRRPTVKEISEAASGVLHNTPSIAKTSYIHPAVLALADRAVDISQLQFDEYQSSGLRAEERRLLSFLEKADA